MNGQPELIDGQCANGCTPEENNAPYRIGGLTWSLPVGHRMEDYLLFYVGSDDSAFANILMTYNTCEIGEGFSFLCVKLSLFALIYLAVKTEDCLSDAVPLHLLAGNLSHLVFGDCKSPPSNTIYFCISFYFPIRTILLFLSLLV